MSASHFPIPIPNRNRNRNRNQIAGSKNGRAWWSNGRGARAHPVLNQCYRGGEGRERVPVTTPELVDISETSDVDDWNGKVASVASGGCGGGLQVKRGRTGQLSPGRKGNK